jgi:hypothetical protein
VRRVAERHLLPFGHAEERSSIATSGKAKPVAATSTESARPLRSEYDRISGTVTSAGMTRVSAAITATASGT